MDVLAELLGSTDLADAYRDADADGRHALLGAPPAEDEADLDPHGRLAVMADVVLLDQIADELDPHTAATARRLLDGGLTGPQARTQLGLAMLGTLDAAVGDPGTALDPDVQRRLMDRLPLPHPVDVADALLATLTELGPSTDEVYRTATLQRLGRDPDDDLAAQLLEQVEDSMIQSPDQPITWLLGDRAAATAALAAGITLTHRLTAAEVADDTVLVSIDLALFAGTPSPRLPDGQDLDAHVHGDELVWHGPTGWLSSIDPGSVVAVTVDAEGTVHLQVLDPPPAVAPGLADAARRVVEALEAEIGLPPDQLDVLAELVADDPTAFAEPQAPLTDLLAATGVTMRGTAAATDPASWQAQDHLDDHRNLREALDDDPDLLEDALLVLQVVDALAEDPTEEAPDDRDGDRTTALDLLTDPEVVLAVQQSLLLRAERDGPTPSDVLLPHADTRRRTAAVRHLAALEAEDAGHVLAAEQQLELAHDADPDRPDVIDRLAWYAADRGDAARAVRLWRRLDPTPAVQADLDVVLPFLRIAGPEPGRNDPCWCGSGRKHKRCHLGVAPAAPLADRVGWLWHKAISHVERYPGTGPQADVVDVLVARVGEDQSAWADGMGDGLVMDLVLTEGGWFERFLDDRGPLLPEDESLLADSWRTIERTVYEITAVRPGDGLSLRDLRSAEAVEVRERTLSATARVGERICARAVPDGTGSQLVGAVIGVDAGRARQLLDRIDAGDPVELAEWFGAAAGDAAGP